VERKSSKTHSRRNAARRPRLDDLFKKASDKLKKGEDDD
jgi:hypothetical protein